MLGSDFTVLGPAFVLEVYWSVIWDQMTLTGVFFLQTGGFMVLLGWQSLSAMALFIKDKMCLIWYWWWCLVPVPRWCLACLCASGLGGICVVKGNLK